MKVGIIQQANTADKASNIAKLTHHIRECASQKAELVVLQELHNTPYFCQNEEVATFDLAEPIPGSSTTHFGVLAKELGIVLVLSLFEKRDAGLYHNTAVVIEKDGTIAGKYRKMHIPDDPGFYEKFYFTPGDLGFEPITTSVGNLGVLVCWDQWFPEAARLMAMRGAELLIYPTAIGWDRQDSREEQLRQLDAWRTIQRGHAIANGLPVIAVNRVGYEPQPTKKTSEEDLSGIHFWGNSFIAGPQGELLCELPHDEECVRVVEVSTARSEEVRRWWPFFRDRRIDAFEGLTKRYLKG